MSDVRSILFVCTGNSCRSVMAEGLMTRKLSALGRDFVAVRSAGVRALSGLPPTGETVEAMKEAGIDVSGLTAKNITADMVRSAGLILVMEPMHKDEVITMAPDAAGKTYLLKEYGVGSRIVLGGYVIRDPIGQGMPEYRMCRDEISREVDRIAGIL